MPKKKKKRPIKPPAEKPAALVLPAWLPLADWLAFIDMRRAIRAPLTDYAKELAIKRLNAFMCLGDDPAEVLQQSILNSWRGLFSVKNRSTINGHAKSPLATACDDLILRTRAMCERGQGVS